MPKKILIVDDAAGYRSLLRSIVERVGYEVVDEVWNGSLALECYEKNLPDLVIMNIEMPVMDGSTAAQIILNQHSDANIIFCSSEIKMHIIQHAQDIGVKACYPKSGTSNHHLVEIIKEIIGDP